jgi:hypothetical protein
MEISEAQAMVSHTPERVSDLRQRLAAHHSDTPQRAMLADLALKGIEEHLGLLRSLGHSFYLTEQSPDEPAAFPMMLYRDATQGRVDMLAKDEAERDWALQNGWRDHPDTTLASKPAEVQPEPEPPHEEPTQDPPPPPQQY